MIEIKGTIQADPIHLQHLFRNLFENAIEHGGEDVTVRVGDLDDGFYVDSNDPDIIEERGRVVFGPDQVVGPDEIGLGLSFVAHLAESYDWDCIITESESSGTRVECTGIDIVDNPARG